MKINIIIITLMVMLSMVMVSAASTDNFTLKDTYDGVTFDVEVECNGYNYRHGHSGDFEIEGIAEHEHETYNVDLDAKGFIQFEYHQPSEVPYDILITDINGKLYQNSEKGYLYKDNDYEYYGYTESGYIVDGWIDKCHIHYDEADLGLTYYSMYVITKSKPQSQFTLSSPALGLGYNGSVAGDYIPELFTYRDQNTWDRVVSETFPMNHEGVVICTPARIAGEPIQETKYWNSAKGQRVLEWKANTT